MLVLSVVLHLAAAELPSRVAAGFALASEAGPRTAMLGGSVRLDSVSAPPDYDAGRRAVGNWRLETLRGLQPFPAAVLAAGLGESSRAITRCVKLNNYWCIKRSRWNGEVGADEEGHAGFATAEHGADAAVTLLRRYYLEFGRKSALDIVRRWAPAECRATLSAAPLGAAPVLPSLAVRGLQSTLRARYLASRRGRAGRPAIRAAQPASPASSGPGVRKVQRAQRAVPGSLRQRASAVPLRPLPVLQVPDIAAGLGVRRAGPATATRGPTLGPTPRAKAASAPTPLGSSLSRFAPTPLPGLIAVSEPPLTLRDPVAGGARTAPAAPPIPATIAKSAAPLTAFSLPAVDPCKPDEQRLRNYAASIAEGLGLASTADLSLFEPDGRPLPNLIPVLLAMSGFELGALRASARLVAGAVERATLARGPSARPSAGPEPPAAGAP